MWSCDGRTPETSPGEPLTGGSTDGVTGSREISLPGSDLTLRVPRVLPVLTPRAARILLAILVEMTDLHQVDGPKERPDHDC